MWEISMTSDIPKVLLWTLRGSFPSLRGVPGGFSIGYTLDAVGPIVVASMLSIFVWAGSTISGFLSWANVVRSPVCVCKTYQTRKYMCLILTHIKTHSEIWLFIYKHYKPYLGVSWNGGTPKSSISGIFPSKTIQLLGFPNLWTPPY